MKRKVIFTFIAIYSLAAGLGFFLSNANEDNSIVATEQVASYILQGESTEAVVAAVQSVDGVVTHEFEVINAVAARLTLPQRDALLDDPAVIAINEDAPAKTARGSTGGAT